MAFETYDQLYERAEKLLVANQKVIDEQRATIARLTEQSGNIWRKSSDVPPPEDRWILGTWEGWDIPLIIQMSDNSNLWYIIDSKIDRPMPDYWMELPALPFKE